MYEDFKFLNYWKTKHKIDKLTEMARRLVNDLEMKRNRMFTIESSIKTLQDYLNKTTIANQTDLIVTEIIPTIYYNYAHFDVIIKNIGDIASLSCTLTITISSGMTYDIALPALNVNETHIAECIFYFNGSGASETYTLSAVADSSHVNNEITIVNNTKTISFDAKTAYAFKTGVVVHCHNPEGKEINSITGMSGGGYEFAMIYDDDIPIGWGAYDSNTNNAVHQLEAGMHLINVRFNGMRLNQFVEIKVNEISILTFTFTRVSFDIASWISNKNIIKEINTHEVWSWPSHHHDEWLYGVNLYNFHWLQGDYAGLTSIADMYTGVIFTGTTFQVKLDSIHTVIVPTGHGVGWDSGAEVGTTTPYTGGSFPATDFASPRTDFTRWIVQTITSGFVGEMRLVFNTGFDDFYSIIPCGENKNQLIEMNADKIYSQGRFGLTYMGGYWNVNPYFWGPSDPNGGTKEAHLNKIGNINIKCASVPYDLDGHAI
jgi:hypothetical protein